ncbi:MAG: bifunctional non-ous end joining protein LigD [Actinomycetota bacterium]|jgi:bifunctional non-homologous end joining protein LigD|nr:bifunctional non-ous end joining protein LigD [Actinomycetota bacterium]
MSSTKAASSKSEVKIGSRTLTLSNPDKVYWPEVGFTKGEMVAYYRAVAPVIVPHLKNRAVTLKRYPEGVDGFSFFEKNCSKYRPDWVRTVDVDRKKDGKTIHYCVGWDEATLVWMANLGSIELHISLSRASNLMRPTAMVYDLDPGAPASIVECCELALEMKKRFAKLGLEMFPKTSGSKGLHLYVPLNTAATFERTSALAHAIALEFEQSMPDMVVSTQKKTEREGKVLIDWSQNGPHKTTVAVYSLRAKELPTCSTPVTWREVSACAKKGDPAMLRFTADDVIKRVKSKGDLFEPVLSIKQKLPKV